MQITLGFSPCPNDTFIFDAIVNKRIDLEGLEFEIILADVEKLNQLAFQKTLDVTKLSYHALALLMSNLAPDLLIRSKENASASSVKLNISCSVPGFQPKKAKKFKVASFR